MTSATVVESLFFATVSVVTILVVAIFLPRTVSKGSPSNEIGDFFAAHPVLIGIVVVAVILISPLHLAAREAASRRRVEEGQAGRGDLLRPAPLRARGRIAFRALVRLPDGRDRGVHGRIRPSRDLLHRFPVASSHMLSQLFAITPGGVGQTQALDLVTLRRYASSESIAAFSVTQDSVDEYWAESTPRRLLKAAAG